MRVIGNNAESGVGGVFLHDPSQRHLSDGSHGVGFVEDNELEAAEGGGVAGFR